MPEKPHIVLVVARGEAVRNFLYSDMLPQLSRNAQVTLLSLVEHGEIVEQVRPHVDKILPLREYKEHPLLVTLEMLTHYAHFRWLWSEAVKYHWGLHDARAKTFRQKIQRVFVKIFARIFAFRPALRLLTRLDEWLGWTLRPTRDFESLFAELKPDLVFNCSHIHGPQADLPLRIASRMKIPTASFVFSWDNLTSRSRIFVPYDYYLMWNEDMKKQLLGQYPEILGQNVLVTGTPQFDFHFKSEFIMPREELCARMGLDPKRPFVLYTTGLDTDFLDEHKFIEGVIEYLNDPGLKPKPQLVVRTYIKGTSPQVEAIAKRNLPDVVFPPILWDKQWTMPLHEDLSIYSSLLHHCALGINAASTVTLELMALRKPVINIGMEPPGSKLPHYARFSRHVEYEHYLPVAASGGAMVARSMDDLRNMIHRGLTQPNADSDAQAAFMNWMLGSTLDGNSGRRVAETLFTLARR